MNKTNSLEQEVRQLLAARRVQFEAYCDDFDRLDFCIDSPQRGRFCFDAKEKRQPVKMDNWPEAGIPQEHLFILDDLAARKALKFAPNSGLVVRDNIRGLYFFFSVVDLFLMPRRRVNRPIGSYDTKLKGKWLIDLRNGAQCASLLEVFERIAAYHDAQEEIFQNLLACYGDYHGEQVGRGGVTRQAEHWLRDRQSTR
jgi:hypothetical protein